MRDGYRRAIDKYIKGKNHLTGLSSVNDLNKLDNTELLSLMRHESHRIEKTIYNNILEAKYQTYRQKWSKLGLIYQILAERQYPQNEPTLVWSKQIYDAFSNLERDFIQQNSTEPATFSPDSAGEFVDFLQARRSVRVWATQQPDETQLRTIAHQMIEGAKWAPTSGNRQPWRFLIMTDMAEKKLLTGIKENHCINAPLLIYIGMDTRLYGALGKSERSIYIDAGAAIMQMVLVAHKCGLGVCWNHFADDLIGSRPANVETYADFARQLNIPEYVTPVAIIATGIPKFIPPEPPRMANDNLLIRKMSL